MERQEGQKNYSKATCPSSDSWDNALRPPPLDRAAEKSVHEVATSRHVESGAFGNKNSSSHGGGDSMFPLLSQIGQVNLLSATEEQDLARTLQRNRKECEQVLFSFMPVARDAFALVSEAVVEGCKHHHTGILDINTVDSHAAKTAVIEKTRLIMAEVGGLLNWCSDQWKSSPAGKFSEAEREGVIASVLQKQKNIGLCLSQVPMRSTFVAEFLSRFESFVSTARAYRKEVDETVDGEARERKKEALEALVSGAEETLETLVAKSNQLFRAHQMYISAKSTLVTSNVRLAVSEAKRVRNRGLPMDDLIQEAVVGVMIAAERFDVERGCRFSTYAVPWIRQRLHEALDKTAHSVRIPQAASAAMRAVRAFERDFKVRHERSPTSEEIFGAFENYQGKAHITADWMRDMLPASQPVSSLDSPLDGSAGKSLRMGDTIADRSQSPWEAVQNEMQSEQRARDIARSVADALDEKQRSIIVLRFGLNGKSPMSATEVGMRLGMNTEMVRQLETRALKKLRSSQLREHYAPENPHSRR